ncbi:MAG: hypothetical protein Kow0069_29410 [Promethearchaeota archaeon]
MIRALCLVHVASGDLLFERQYEDESLDEAMIGGALMKLAEQGGGAGRASCWRASFALWQYRLACYFDGALLAVGLADKPDDVDRTHEMLARVVDAHLEALEGAAGGASGGEVWTDEEAVAALERRVDEILGQTPNPGRRGTKRRKGRGGATRDRRRGSEGEERGGGRRERRKGREKRRSRERREGPVRRKRRRGGDGA